MKVYESLPRGQQHLEAVRRAPQPVRRRGVLQRNEQQRRRRQSPSCSARREGRRAAGFRSRQRSRVRRAREPHLRSAHGGGHGVSRAQRPGEIRMNRENVMTSQLGPDIPELGVRRTSPRWAPVRSWACCVLSLSHWAREARGPASRASAGQNTAIGGRILYSLPPVNICTSGPAASPSPLPFRDPLPSLKQVNSASNSAMRKDSCSCKPSCRCC